MMMRSSSICFFLFTTIFLPTIQASISSEKCVEYEEYSYSVSCLGSVSADFGTTCNRKYHCEQAIPLIVGGEIAKDHEFPHFALLGYNFDGELQFKCGGTLISENYIVSAAHCKSSGEVEVSIVRLGESDFSRNNGVFKDYEVQEFIQHDDYSSITDYNDIGLIKLKKNVQFSKNIRPACLHQNNNEILMNQHSVAIGFGRTGFDGDPSEVLRKVGLTILHPTKCFDLNGKRGLRKQLCLKGNLTDDEAFGDTCQGDSGGPILRKHLTNPCMDILIGITSIGKWCGSDNPAIYTQISSFIPWIERIVWRH